MPRNSITNPTPKKVGPRENGRDDEDDKAAIRVGRQFQAEIPKFAAIDASNLQSDSYYDSLNICIWKPPDRLDRPIKNDQIEKYLKEAVEDYGYSAEQALGVLFFNKYDMDQAKQDILKYCPVEDPIDSWDEDDRILFETAYKLNSKSFSKIQETLPNKKISELVHYYYTWKKNKAKHKTSCRYDRPLNRNGNGREAPDSKIGQLMPAGFRPVSPVSERDSPHDYNISIDSVEDRCSMDIFTNGEPISLDLQDEVKSLDRVGLQVKNRIQQTKQNIEMMQNKLRSKLELSPNIAALKEASIMEPVEVNQDPNDASETYKFILALKDYGTDFEKIGKVIRTKTPKEWEKFYTEKKKQFSLEKYVRQYVKNRKT